MPTNLPHHRYALSKLASVLIVSIFLLIGACSESSNDQPNSKTVLSPPQQQGLAVAKQMELKLQEDVERREQQMRDEGI